MREYIDENDKKNEIRLLLKHPHYKEKVIIVVEGHSDVRLFRSLLDCEYIEIQTVDGKRPLKDVMKTLVSEFPNQLLAICDADFDHLINNTQAMKDYSICLTDEHDAEIMMLNSPSLDSFFMEYSSLENSSCIRTNLFEKVSESAYLLGLLRWVNFEENLNINFKGLNFNIFVDVNKVDVKIDTTILIEELLRRSRHKNEQVTKEFLLEKIKNYQQKNADKLQVCCGHDITNLIAIAFRQRWVSLELNMDHKKVESSLRVGYQKSFFSNTQLFKDIRDILISFGFEFNMC